MIRGSILPNLGLVFSIPDPFIETSRAIGLHMRVSRHGADIALQYHNALFFKDHFSRANRAKYHHKKRNPNYERMKQYRYHSFVDLIKGGTSRDAMLSQNPKTSFKNKMPSGTIWAYMRYKWPHPVGAQTQSGVTEEQMNREIGTWTDGEVEVISDVFASAWAKEYNRQLLQTKKWRKQIGDVSLRI